MSAVHFSINNGTALACGRSSGNVTTKRGDVSCQKCKATRVFKTDLGFHPSGEIDEEFTPTRVDPPLVQVTWETFSDFVRENPFMVPVVIARAIDWGNEHNLETWVDVREGGPFYWKGGVA